METAFLFFLLLILLIVSCINMFFLISSSMVMIKVYDYLKNQEERNKLEEEARLRARGLVDLPNSVTYDVGR